MKSNNKKLILFSSIFVAILFAIFLTLSILILCKYNFNIDSAFINIMNNVRSSNFTQFVKIFTHLGSVVLFFAITVLLFILLKGSKNKIFVAMYFVAVCVTSIIVKYIFQRPRPENIALIVETGFSFPSAHAMLSMAFYGLLIYFAWQFLNKKSYKIIITVVLSLIILFVSLSRIYLGVHYFTDIFGGLLLGAICLVIGILVHKRLKTNLKLNKDNIETEE